MPDWDSFTIDAKRDRPQKPPCGIAVLLAELGDPAAKVLAATLADPGITSSAIERALRARNVNTVARDTIARHRRAECSCARGDR